MHKTSLLVIYNTLWFCGAIVGVLAPFFDWNSPALLFLWGFLAGTFTIELIFSKSIYNDMGP